VFGTMWSTSCIAPEIKSTSSPAFSAKGLSSTTTLDTLDVVVTATPTTGVSLYGITSDDSMLALSNVSVTVPAGGPGQEGTTGGAGKAGNDGGCSPPDSGAVGSNGAAGNPTGAGMFSAPPTGFVPASDGTNGAMGGQGSNGVQGAFGGSVSGYSDCVSTGATACGGTRETFEGGPGIGGCPGGGGHGGTPGTGGGCSIAVYAWGGSVTITGGTLKTGGGGAGGNGGNGGMGGGGAPGVQGSPATGFIKTCFYDGLTGDCHTLTGTAPGGDAGGLGGTGGMGGPGGGGAGGCSYGYYEGGGATVTASGTTFDYGAGGPHGMPNGSTGPSAKHN
jgi:hypothetical protein